MIDFDSARDAAAFDAHATWLGIELGDARAPSLRFAELVSQWGRKTDLVKASTVEALIDVLFTDAWVLTKLIPEGPRIRVIDVGAGAGAPTLPLALCLPRVHAVLLEPRRRRVAFMRTAVGALGLRQRVEVVEGRLEDHEPPEPHDLALSRATFEPAEWLERGGQLADRVVVLLAGQDPPTRVGWSLIGRTQYRTRADAPRQAVVFHRDP